MEHSNTNGRCRWYSQMYAMFLSASSFKPDTWIFKTPVTKMALAYFCSDTQKLRNKHTYTHAGISKLYSDTSTSSEGNCDLTELKVWVCMCVCSLTSWRAWLLCPACALSEVLFGYLTCFCSSWLAQRDRKLLPERNLTHHERIRLHFQPLCVCVFL